MRELTRTNICSEISHDASQDVTGPSDVSYDEGRVSANHRHDLERLMPAANRIHRRQHPSTVVEKQREGQSVEEVPISVLSELVPSHVVSP